MKESSFHSYERHGQLVRYNTPLYNPPRFISFSVAWVAAALCFFFLPRSEAVLSNLPVSQAQGGPYVFATAMEVAIQKVYCTPLKQLWHVIRV